MFHHSQPRTEVRFTEAALLLRELDKNTLKSNSQYHPKVNLTEAGHGTQSTYFTCTNSCSHQDIVDVNIYILANFYQSSLDWIV